MSPTVLAEGGREANVGAVPATLVVASSDCGRPWLLDVSSRTTHLDALGQITCQPRADGSAPPCRESGLACHTPGTILPASRGSEAGAEDRTVVLGSAVDAVRVAATPAPTPAAVTTATVATTAALCPASALRARYIARLLEAMNLDPTFFEDLHGAAFGAAIAANEAFTRARHSNQMLDQQLTVRDEEAQISLDQAYTHLKGKLRPGADWERQLLRDAYQEIEQSWPVIMLLPNGPYETVLKSMVEALEADAGAGGLSTEQTELYDIARALVDAFRGNARGNEVSWRRLEAGFNQAPLAGEKRVAFDDGRTLN